MPITAAHTTLAIAVLGAVLGILNFYRAVVRDRVNIKIRPSLYFMAPPGGESFTGLCVEVVNLGFIPVTISNAYFQMQDDSLFADLQIRTNLGLQKIPIRLDPRESTTFFFNSELNAEMALLEARCVLVKTACGINLKNSNKEFRKWIKSRLKE